MADFEFKPNLIWLRALALSTLKHCTIRLKTSVFNKENLLGENIWEILMKVSSYMHEYIHMYVWYLYSIMNSLRGRIFSYCSYKITTIKYSFYCRQLHLQIGRSISEKAMTICTLQYYIEFIASISLKTKRKRLMSLRYHLRR